MYRVRVTSSGFEDHLGYLASETYVVPSPKNAKTYRSKEKAHTLASFFIGLPGHIGSYNCYVEKVPQRNRSERLKAEMDAERKAREEMI